MGGRENETGRNAYLCFSVSVCGCRESITVREQAERTLKKKLKKEKKTRKNSSLKEKLWNFQYQYLIKNRQNIIEHVSTAGLPGK